ncbi:unnamed protein product [Plutella xylostella]|uniref:(diamondback moth) hypothetical protein n=1 Tax=Plutella xylostella TaxID=51655 RepID=A0A8S4FAQ3_PLUXY|nr:unnamed protein product [Plutella xylostella]
MVGDGRCTFGTRMPLDIHMLNEMIHREQKHFRNYRTYTPNFGSIPVTGKFYARHDQLPDDQTDADGDAGAEAARRGEEYCERVAQARALGPRARCDYPATENQVYGWYPGPIYPLDRGDRRFFHPRRESDHTKVAVVIRTCNPKDRKQGA